ncbi:MAG TPA: NUDIX domain-containing protein [Candidatus Moranbacteria bacterium]|nr:NUDIX domain-containing protein [Candidatus Moranbacteria bacterium]
MPHIHELIDFVVTAYIVYDGKVLLIHHKGLDLWLPIGGHIELNEDPEEALYREVKEECGLEIELISTSPNYSGKDAKFMPIPNFLDIHNITDAHRHITLEYVAKAKNNEVKLNEEEHYDIRWFSEEDLNNFPLRDNVKFLANEAIKIVKAKDA